VKLNDAVINLQERILAAQAATTSSRERIRELEETVAAFNDWKQIADRYTLKDYGQSTYAYELKADQAKEEPQHRLCPVCFEARKRSILQFQFVDASKRDFYKCLSCAAEFRFGFYQQVSQTGGRRAPA
jgi:DNA-directed RNA polymerase subunit M/transcription elongation factor TFIIS